jgi:hypothetical protein
MEQHIFHGNLAPRDLARVLIGEFNGNGYRAQQYGNGHEIIVQIHTNDWPKTGGATALTVTLRAVQDGVAVQIGKQSWLGVAASLGQSALATVLNPWNLIGRLDDIAQDIESLQLSEKVWEVLNQAAQSLGATFELSERLKRINCEYCQVANPPGQPTCLACGAPLGRVQPRTCLHCGFVVRSGESICPNCHSALS